MNSLVLRIAIFCIAGALCGFASRLWIKYLQEERELVYRLSSKQEIILCLVMAAGGAVIGGLCSGIMVPFCGLLLMCICAAVSIIDWTNRIIPNEAVIAVMLVKLLACIPSVFGFKEGPGFNLVQSLIGFGVCFIVFMVPGLFGKSVGAGDIKLAAAMGFLLGIENALAAVIVMGVLILGYGFVQKDIPVLSYLKNNIPMGPFIASGMLLVFVGSNYSI